jgi:hypothetical protein
MATELGIMDLSFLAGEHLNTAQYQFVVLTSSGTVRRPDNESETAIGVLQNDPYSGEVAVVRVQGIAKLAAATALPIGTFVRPEYVSTYDAGKGKPAGMASQYTRGMVVEAAGAEDDVASVLLCGPNPAVLRQTYEDFKINPVTSKVGGGAAGGTTGNVNTMSLGGNVFEYHIIGTQTITAPSLAATGLDVGMDQTQGDGVEITQGILSGRSKAAFTVGTDAFYAKCKFSIEDVSGLAECAFGFRTAEAYQAAIDDYNNMAVLNVQAGAIKIETIDDNAATTTTDTTNTWADGATHTLEVYVSAARAVTYKIDGAVPITTAAFFIDDGDVVIPFFHMVHGSDVGGAVVLKEWEVGLQ